LLAALWPSSADADGFDLQYSINDPSGFFTPTRLSILNDALVHVERMWETVVTGYRPGITIPPINITIQATDSGLAAASYSGTSFQGGYLLPTSGFINVNYLEIENFANWQGSRANGLNFIDELLAHETGHVLGIGTLWGSNNVYIGGTYQYTGQYGVAAYKAEFDAGASFVPVENVNSSLGSGTVDAHWDQRMRSSDSLSADHGNPVNPWALSPLVGVTDQYGRDRGLELMTGAIDPDFKEPFISRFTVQSLRDLGYAVTEFEDFNGDGFINAADRDILLANLGASGLQIDSIAFGDANRDRRVDGTDLKLWRIAAGIPEPGSLIIAMSWGLVIVFRRRCRK
jgi:hypothetical protein